MKSNIFRLMETEIWDGISKHLQNFMIRLSLIGHLSVDLLELLAENDMNLIADLERQNALKMVINNVYMKLGAENLADAIRIAMDRKII